MSRLHQHQQKTYSRMRKAKKQRAYTSRHIRKYRGQIVRLRFYRSAPAPYAGAPANYVLIHGLGVSSAYFQRLISELRSTGHVLTIDLPGFGKTPRPDHKLNINDYAQLVVDAITEFYKKPATVAGHSMGAQVALEVARIKPQAVYALTLVGLPQSHSRHALARTGWNFTRSGFHEPPGLTWLALRSYIACGFLNFTQALPAVINYRALDTLEKLEGITRVRLVRGEYDYVSPTRWITAVSRTLHARGIQVFSSFAPRAAHSVLFDNDEWLATMITDAADIKGPSLRRRLKDQIEGDEDIWQKALHSKPAAQTPSARELLQLIPKISPAIVHETIQDLTDLYYNLIGLKPPKRWEEGHKLPILAIPGINQSWVSLRNLLEVLNQDGHPIITVPGLGRSVPEPQELAELVIEALSSNKISQCAIVAHSKGGLIARALMRTPIGVEKVQKVVTLGTPYAGSPWGKLFPRSSQIGRLRPHAPFFNSSDGDAFPYERFTVFSSDFDHKVLSRSFLHERAAQKTIGGYGHSLPLRSPRFAEEVKKVLS